MTNIEIYTLEKDLIDKKDNQLDEPVKVVSTRMLNKKLTSKRRKDMRVKVIEFNISNNHLAQEKKLYLKQLLTEAKYYYNYLLNLSQHSCVDDYGNIVYTNPIFSIDTKNNHIEVFNTATLEVMPYEIKNLSSQVKQKIKDKITDSIKALSKRKSKGFKVGQLKFKSEVNIPLKQFNNTYYLADDFKYLSIQGSKFNFKLNPHKAIKKLSKELGFSQLSIQGLLDNKIIEIANAEIIKGLNKSKLNSNYKLSLTIYINPEIYDDDKLLIIKHNIRNYLKTKINLFGTTATNDFDKSDKLRVGKNRIKEAKILKELELKKKLKNKPIEIKETKQPEINQLNHIPYKNIPNHIESNQITAFNFNLTPGQRAVISLTGIGLDAGIGDEITLNCGKLYQSFSLNSRLNEFLLCTLAKIKIAQKELSQFNHRSKRLNKHKLSTGNNEDNNLLKQDKVKIVNIKGINKPLFKPTIIYSRKYQQLKNRLAKLWIKYENIKTNMINHLIGFLKQFKQVSFQNEMIKSWHQDKLKGYSKKVQAGILGKVYAKLKLLNQTDPNKYTMLATYHKTTQDCVMCGKSNKLKLSDRVYKCSCGYENNRDTHGSFNMILKSNKNNQSLKNKVFGRNTANLVQIITSGVSKENTENVFDIAGSKLESKSYVKLSFNSHISHTRSLVL